MSCWDCCYKDPVIAMAAAFIVFVVWQLLASWLDGGDEKPYRPPMDEPQRGKK